MAFQPSHSWREFSDYPDDFALSSSVHPGPRAGALPSLRLQLVLRALEDLAREVASADPQSLIKLPAPESLHSQGFSFLAPGSCLIK